MDFISVKNLEKYQPHYNDGRSIIWIRWNVKAVCDYKISKLTPAQRWLFIGLTCLASEQKNKIPYDLKWLSEETKYPKACISKDISMLQTMDLILVTKCDKMSQNVTKCDLRYSTVHNSTVQNNTEKLDTSDSSFIDSLKASPAYKHVNIDIELAKMDVWLKTNKGKRRTKTRAFIVNWLNRIDAPVATTVVKAAPKVMEHPKAVDPVERDAVAKLVSATARGIGGIIK